MKLERIDGVLSLVDEGFQPLSVDFSSPQILHRLRTSGKNQPIAKAVAVATQPSVIDCTAGLGTDALVLASLGCRVRSLERNETIFALLEDGLARLRAVDADLASRLSFEHADAREVLAVLTEKPDVVYMDPMYPEDPRAKALPKKTMQMFRKLLEGDLDADDLFTQALVSAKKRVVVKRPMHAPDIAGKKPNHSFEGKTARFDLYLTVMS